MGIFTFDAHGQISGFEEKPNRDRLAQIGRASAGRRRLSDARPEPPVHRVDGHLLFTREVLLELLEQQAGIDFGRELIPAALTRYRVSRVLTSRLLGRCRHHRQLLRREHHADAA